MTIFANVTLTAPYLRVNNRNQNLDFYQNNLGLKLIREENALAFLGGHTAKQIRLTLEESPAYRTRAVVGTKKLQTLALKAPVWEIAELLARQVPVQQVFRGEQGYAFSALSPEGDAILLHAEEDPSTLIACDYPKLPAQSDFVGLSDVTVSTISLHVVDKAHSDLFYAGLPVVFETSESTGVDLQTPHDQIWDLESLELAVPADCDLVAVQAHFSSLGAETFLNKKQTILVAIDPSNIELWFIK